MAFFRNSLSYPLGFGSGVYLQPQYMHLYLWLPDTVFPARFCLFSLLHFGHVAIPYFTLTHQFSHSPNENMLVPCELPVIIFGDHTKAIKFINFPFVAGADGIKVIKPDRCFLPKLFFYFLFAIDLPDKGYARHFQYLEKEFIPLPPLPEQERIVAKIEALFSQLDAGVAGLRRIQAGLKRYKASVLKAACEGRLVGQDPADEPAGELLRRLGKSPLAGDDLPSLPAGWEWVRVGDIGKVKGGKRLPAGHDYSDEMTAFPYIRVVDFHELSVRSNDLRYLKPETQAMIRQYTISKDDVYISIAGSIGKVGLIPEYLDRANLTENAAKITELQAIGNKFLAYSLASPIPQVQISESTISTTQPKLALFRIEKIQIPIAPFCEQQRIVAEVERRLSVAAEVEAVVAALLARSARLRQAVLRQAFSGRL